MEIRRMHELVEQTTQVLQQADGRMDGRDVWNGWTQEVQRLQVTTLYTYKLLRQRIFHELLLFVAVPAC